MKVTLRGDGEGEAAPWGQEPESPHSADRAEEQWKARSRISHRCKSPAAPVGRKGGSCGCEFLIMVGLKTRPAVAKGGRSSAMVVKMLWEEGMDELGAGWCRGCACAQLCCWGRALGLCTAW